MASFRAAMKYGYSNTRVRAMISRMVGRSAMTEMSESDNVSAILGSLHQTEYRKHLEHYGGESIKVDMVDFALNRSFEMNVAKLIDISPRKQKALIEPVISRSDYQNIKLVLRAKSKGVGFDTIAKYITPSKRLDEQAMRSALDEQGVDGAAKRLMKTRAYSKAISKALEVYNRSGKMSDLEESIDRSMLEDLSDVIAKITRVSRPAGALIRREMEMRNILTMMRAKRGGMSADELKPNLFGNGVTSVKALITIYEAAKDPSEIAKAARKFKLGEIAESMGDRDILPYEIEMRRQILEMARSVMRKNILSFGVIVAYYYIMEAETSSLRSLINGKAYNLGKEEIAKMVTW